MSCNMTPFFANANETFQFMTQLKHSFAFYNRIHGHLSLLICVTGVVTNIGLLAVLTRPRMRTLANVLLAAIAICDTGTMVTNLLYVAHFHVFRPKCTAQLLSTFWAHFIILHELLSIYLHTTSLWLNVLLAFTRLLVISSPNRYHSRISSSNSFGYYRVLKRQITAVFVVIALFMIPPSLHSSTYIEDKVATRSDPIECWNLTGPRWNVDYSEVAILNNCLVVRICLWTNGLFFKLLPCFCLTVLILLLLRSYKEAQDRRKRFRRHAACATLVAVPEASAAMYKGSQLSLSGPAVDNAVRTPNQRCNHVRTMGRRRTSDFCDSELTTAHAMPLTVQESTTHTCAVFASRTTMLLITILLVSLLTELPQAAYSLVASLYPTDLYRMVYPIIGNVFDLLSLLNSSVNFALYCIMSSLFRDTFIEIFWHRPKQIVIGNWQRRRRHRRSDVERTSIAVAGEQHEEMLQTNV